MLVVKGNSKFPFQIATSPKYRRGYYSLSTVIILVRGTCGTTVIII